MKLANEYKNDSALYKIKNNKIYNYFGDEIVGAIFNTVPDAENANITVANGEINNSIEDAEIKFFEKHYINMEKTNDMVNIGNKTYSIPAELNGKTGNMEDMVLDFIYNGGHRLLITGKKGWGKTTFLRYIVRYIIPKLNNFKDKDNKNHNKPCLPIYISFDSRINSFNTAKEIDYYKLFYKDLLINKIRSCCYTHVSSDIRSGFYQSLLAKDMYSEFRQKYDRIIDHHKKAWITANERDRKLDDLKTEISDKDETILYALAYCTNDNISPAIPVIVLDDLDPLHISVQTYLYTEIYALAHIYQIKIIVSMRPSSVERVSKAVSDALHINNPIVFSDCFVHDYLDGKLSRISNAVTGHIPVQEGISIGEHYIFKPLNAEIFFKNFTDITLYPEILSFLKNLSGGNLRKLNEFIKIYLKSGYIDINAHTFSTLIDNYLSNVSTNTLPIWIVYSAIFTNNYQTVFGKINNQPNKYVVNILCNGVSSINTYLIRLHLLSFFYRNGSTAFSFPTIVERYIKVVKVSSDEVKNDIARAIKRLNNYELLGNDTILIIPEANDPKRIHEQFDDSKFYMEPLGEYYYKTIISIFEYFYFMKDDISFRDDTNILSCVKTQTDIVLRFEQVIAYFEILLAAEVDFYEKLEEWQRIYYKDNFAPSYGDDKIFYVQVFIEKMHAYANTRKYKGIDGIIEKLIALKDRTNEEIHKIHATNNEE